uniref:Uncharacterized protein n=1 Tax=Abalone asfa-like virus TaxID=2839893 RepID=A0A5K7XYN0_9VIRU|nr:hypothetical protein [Abalone asfa-like virus]BCY04629.1 hypothetical protein [Abalone asfa-like virus]
MSGMLDESLSGLYMKISSNPKTVLAIVVGFIIAIFILLFALFRCWWKSDHMKPNRGGYQNAGSDQVDTTAASYDFDIGRAPELPDISTPYLKPGKIIDEDILANHLRTGVAV